MTLDREHRGREQQVVGMGASQSVLLGSPECWRREEGTTIDSVKFGAFLWFAEIRLSLTSCAVKLGTWTYGLDLLHRKGWGEVLDPGGRTCFSSSFSWASPHPLSSVRQAARTFVTRHCDSVCFLSPLLEDACRRSIPEVSLLSNKGVGLYQALSEGLGNE